MPTPPLKHPPYNILVIPKIPGGTTDERPSVVRAVAAYELDGCEPALGDQDAREGGQEGGVDDGGEAAECGVVGCGEDRA